MFTNRKKLILIVGLILIVVLCILGFISLKPNIESFLHNGEIIPIRNLNISIDESQRETLFAQLRKFADKHGFEIMIRDADVYQGPSGNGFYIEILRNDITITAIGIPSAPVTVSINFYENNPEHPPSKQTVDDLFNDLDIFISQIPNVTISQEKYK
jgi:hypothetical protein